jgi:hypothetical protein
MTTVGLPDTFTYTTIELVSRLGRTISLCLRITGSFFYPLHIRHGVRIAGSESSRWVQFVQFDQHKRPASGFASA